MEVEDAEQGGWKGLDVAAEGQQGGLGLAGRRCLKKSAWRMPWQGGGLHRA